MIKRMAGATIWSEDLNNLLPFYRDTLGMKANQQTPDFVLLGDAGGEDYNVAYLALGTHSEVKGKNADGPRHMVAVETDDVDAEFQRLKSAGVEFVEEPTNFDALRIATCKDPEGNYVQMIQFS